MDRQFAWHPAGPEPQGTPFTILRQIVAAHQSLAQKARCAVRDGLIATWSPDSKSIIFSRFDGRHDGVWVGDLEKRKAARVVDDWMCFRCSWTPASRQIALSPAMTIRQTWGVRVFGNVGQHLGPPARLRHFWAWFLCFHSGLAPG